MPTLAQVVPTIINLVVLRKADNPLRVTIYENGAVVDLTGDTLQFLAKDVPGGTTKIQKSMALEVQSGATLGQATVTLTRTELVGPNSPNDSPTDAISWVYEVIRTHGSVQTVPVRGTLTLAARI